MVLDFTHILQLNAAKHVLPRRGLIYVGFQCHLQCGFCYYKNRCNEQMFELDYIIKLIEFEHKYGIRDFEITGGEPSEHKQLRDICLYIKSKHPSSKIAIITNGGLFNSDVWDLIDEVLLSYHLGKDDNCYDKSIFPQGSTYLKAAKTIDKARASNVIVRTNTVAGTFNLDGIEHILHDLSEFKPSIVNFLPVNLFDNASSMSKYIDYSKLRGCMKHAIDFLANNVPDAKVFIRYMPFCCMEGYESHIVGHALHIYDWFDWNRELDGTEFLKKLDAANDELQRLGQYGSTSMQNVIDTRKLLYYKNEKCLHCKYMLICDGVENTPDNGLAKYILPAAGKLIKDPMFFIGDTTERLYKKLYANLDKDK